MDQAARLFDIIKTKTGGYNKLAASLVATKQTQAAEMMQSILGTDSSTGVLNPLNNLTLNTRCTLRS